MKEAEREIAKVLKKCGSLVSHDGVEFSINEDIMQADWGEIPVSYSGQKE